MSLPPDISVSLTAFGSTDAINSSSRFEEVYDSIYSYGWRWICSLTNYFYRQEATSIKKRKLDSDRRSQFEEAISSANQYLEQIELQLDGDANVDDLECRHIDHKPLLDQVLKSGHVLVDDLENGVS